MNELTIGGDFRSALTHLCAWGTAAILKDQGAAQVRVRADLASMAPALSVTWSGAVDAGTAVREHAEAQTSPTSLTGRRYAKGRLSGGAVFSPRITAPPAEEWPAVVAAREVALQEWGRDQQLSTMLVAGLGQPAWWRFDKQGPRADEGASRWEMKTRNRGEEFVKHRLAHLAEAVSARTPEGVVTGLTGATLVDDRGGLAPSSRTATGLQPPGPVDSAAAWCALWALSLLPVVPQAHRFSQTPGACPRRRVHPDFMALPVFRVATVSRFTNVILTNELDTVLQHAALRPGPDSLNDAEMLAARRRLAGLGVCAILSLPTVVGGSKSAPERSLRLGTLDPL